MRGRGGTPRQGGRGKAVGEHSDPSKRARAPRGGQLGSKRVPDPVFDVHVAVAPGLEGVLCEELSELGLKVREVPGGATLKGGADALLRVHLHSRLASRVSARLAGPVKPEAEQLVKAVRAANFDPVLRPHQEVEVDVAEAWGGTGRRDVLAQRVARAVREGSRGAGRQDLSLRSGRVGTVSLRVVHEGSGCALVVDASGELLHKRGWRRDGGPAPLRENLAAAVLRLAGWKPGEALVDPMCGTGTFGIEAACWDRNIAPGVNRSFTFTSWPCVTPKRVSAALDAAKAGVVVGGTAPIHSSDRWDQAAESARSNAKRAGVLGRMKVSCQPFSEVEPPARSGLLVLNPPWGERLEAGASYREIGQVLAANWRGWRVALLAPHRGQLDQTGLRSALLATFPSGGLRVGLYLSEL